jgi:hypothetical protein
MLHLQQKHIFCGWSRNIYFEDQPHPPLILGRSFLKTVRAIDVGKWEIKFNIDGVRSACYMEAETVHKQVRTLSDFSIAPFPFFSLRDSLCHLLASDCVQLDHSTLACLLTAHSFTSLTRIRPYMLPNESQPAESLVGARSLVHTSSEQSRRVVAMRKCSP